MSGHDYIRDGDAIYRRSFAIIRAETDLSRFSEDEADIVVRMVHACGSPKRRNHIVFGHGFAAAARAALAAGAPILCDSEMVAHGITRARLPAGNDVICTLHDPRVPALAKKLGTTRSAAALELWRDRLAGALVAIGNAPTALFHLLDMLDERCAEARGHSRHSGRLRRRGRIQGGAGRRSVRRALSDRARPHRRQRHDRGRRQRAGEGRTVNEPASGRLIGVGVGPGDPELSDA